MKNRIVGFLIVLLFGGVFGGMGLVVLGLGIKKSMLARQSHSWPTATATITESKVNRRSSSDGTTYHAGVKFKFTVNGAQYEDDEVSLGDYGTGGQSRAKKIVARYPVGKKTTVYYKPDDITVAVLEPGGGGGIVIMYVIGGVFTLIGFAILGSSALSFVRGK